MLFRIMSIINQLFLNIISGPLLDRIEMHIEVPRVDYEKLSGDRVGETSESIRRRVQAAIEVNQISVKIEAGLYPPFIFL